MPTPRRKSPGGKFSTVPSGFRLTSSVKESHRKPIFDVAWSSDVFVCDNDDEKQLQSEEESEQESSQQRSTSNNDEGDDDDDDDETNGAHPTRRLLRYLATCGGTQVSLYEVEIPNNDSGRVKNKSLVLRQVYKDPNSEEDFYAIAFGGRSVGTAVGFGPIHATEAENDDSGKQPVVLDNEATTRRDILHEMTTLGSSDGPELLCVAGYGQSIKVIDTVRRRLFFTLSGHLDEVLDLKFSPTDEWLLLSASKDQSIRLWDVKHAACVAIFAGHDAHRETVLSVAWHPLGASFVSGSMDTTIKLWDIGEGTDVSDAIQNSKKTGARLLGRPPPSSARKDHCFQAIWEQTPVFSTNKVHVNYVDCVEFVGDLILSKSIDDEVVLWKPVLGGPANQSGGEGSSTPRIPNEVVSLRSFPLTKAESWFVRFGTSKDSTLLACGNNIGDIRVWTIDAKPKKRNFASLTNQFCVSTVRMVAFSPDSRFLVACCDDSTLFKWDAFY